MGYPAVSKARQDREAGRLWKARDRLGSLLRLDPADQETLVLLGEVHFEMGDLPNAGRYWFLTEREGPEADAALAALHERYPFPDLLSQIPARARSEQYPATVQTRLRELHERAAQSGIKWDPRGRVKFPYSPHSDSRTAKVRDAIVVALFVVLGPGVWLLGIAAAIALMLELTEVV